MINIYYVNLSVSSFQLDIVGQNYISPENLSNPPVLTEVEEIAFSDNGMWLATVERRDDKETTPEIRLKFWIYLQKSQRLVTHLQGHILWQLTVHNMRYNSNHVVVITLIFIVPQYFSYNLNTTVESPHSSKVETLKFRENSKNGSVMAVTTCKDGKFKLWSLIDDTDIYSK